MNLNCVELCVIIFHSSSCISFLQVVFVIVVLVLTSSFEPIVCTPTGIWLHPVCSNKFHISPRKHCVVVYFPLVDAYISIICGVSHIISLYIYIHVMTYPSNYVVYSSLFILTLLWLGYSLFLAKWCSIYHCPRHCQVYEKPKASTGTVYIHWSNPATKDQVIESSCGTSGKISNIFIRKKHLDFMFFWNAYQLPF